MRRPVVVQSMALLAAVALGAAAVWWTLRLDWRAYQDSRPSDPVRVAAGESGSLGGVGFRVTDAFGVAGDGPEGEELGLAGDTRLVVVSLEVAPGEEADLPTCTLDLVAADGDTEWEEAGFTETTYSPPDGFESYCDGEATAPYPLQVRYVVPDDADGPWRVRVTELQLLPRALELELGEVEDRSERSR